MLEAFASWGTTEWAIVSAAAGFICGVVFTQRPKREAPEGSVPRAAERYRQMYGDKALEVIGDHTLAARFAPTHEHYRFLLLVTQELQRGI